MAYCTLEKTSLYAKIPERDVIGLTDDKGLGKVDTDVVAAAIADADAEIDSYAGGRYDVPLFPVPGIIQSVSEEITIHNLYARTRKIPDAVRTRYEDAVKFLLNVAKGIARLDDGAGETLAAADDDIQTTTPKSYRRFTRESLDGY
jgi:phage gp36-like protein